MNDNNTQPWWSSECVLVLNSSEHYVFHILDVAVTDLYNAFFVTDNIVQKQHNLLLPHFSLLLVVDSISVVRNMFFLVW